MGMYTRLIAEEIGTAVFSVVILDQEFYLYVSGYGDCGIVRCVGANCETLYKPSEEILKRYVIDSMMSLVLS